MTEELAGGLPRRTKTYKIGTERRKQSCLTMKSIFFWLIIFACVLGLIYVWWAPVANFLREAGDFLPFEKKQNSLDFELEKDIEINLPEKKEKETIEEKPSPNDGSALPSDDENGISPSDIESNAKSNTEIKLIKIESEIKTMRRKVQVVEKRVSELQQRQERIEEISSQLDDISTQVEQISLQIMNLSSQNIQSP